MQIKHVALALALTMGAPLAMAQTVTNPPSGSMGTNTTENNHGTLNSQHKSARKTSTSRSHTSHKTVESQEKTDLSQGTARTEPTNMNNNDAASTAHTVQGMSNGTSINSGNPNVPVKANNGG